MKLPLAGIRAIELTHVWSGPLCGQILADLGAEVIRVESRTHLDIHRRGGPYPDGLAGLNRSGTWNAQNRNKLGCTLDLKHPEGRQLLLDLAARSAVVIENFTPATLQRLGIGFDALRQVNHAITLLSLSGYGHTGPLRNALAYGPMMDAATGLSAATTYADGIPRAVNGWAADVGGALYGCAAVVRALTMTPRIARHLDIAQFEAGVMFLAGPLMDTLNPGLATPQIGAVQCVAETRDADDWIAVSAGTLDEMTSLFDLIAGRAAATALLRTWQRAGAAACTAALQPDFERWARGRSRTTALLDLQSAGIPAAPISQLAELLADAELAQRGAWSMVQHAETGDSQSYGPAIHLADAAGKRAEHPRPAPLFGGDNDQVYGDILGLSAARIAQLTQAGII